MQQRWEYNKPDNLVDLCEEGVRRFTNNKLFGVKSADGKSLKWSTYGEIGKRVDNLRAGLALLGVGKGDSVGIIANNCPDMGRCGIRFIRPGRDIRPDVRGRTHKNLQVYNQRQQREGALRIEEINL